MEPIPAITPAALIDRLMEVYDASSQEDLARRLGVPARRVSDYKAGKGMQFGRTIEFLERAGWLNTAADGRVSAPFVLGPQEEIAAALRDLVDGQAEILRRLPPAAAAATRRVRPRRKRG
jgi:transcriptional regulator with XRE-family HTH domain